jgi:DNA processing protein
MSIDDLDYPENLRQIHNPPTILFTVGKIPDLPCLTVVGTRDANPYTIDVTKYICSNLAKVGFCIVSGFAVGIDITAHLSALNAGKPTVAVLGCGLGVEYPREHAREHSPKIAENGAIITEYFPGSKADRSHFRPRNRILSGLSKGTFVVQAGEKSGALLTGEWAIDQNRELFCLPPPNIFDQKYAGVVKYLREGAIPVYDYIDIVKEYYLDFADSLETLDIENATPKPDFSTVDEKSVAEKINPKTKNIEYTEINPDEIFNDTNHTSDSAKVLKLMSANSVYIDDISAETGLTFESVMAIVTELELLGYVQNHSGQRFTLAENIKLKN